MKLPGIPPAAGVEFWLLLSAIREACLYVLQEQAFKVWCPVRFAGIGLLVCVVSCMAIRSERHLRKLEEARDIEIAHEQLDFLVWLAHERNLVAHKHG